MVYYHHVRLGKHMGFWKIINLGCIWILWFPAHFRKLMWELLFTSLASQSRSSHLPLLKHSSGRKFFRQEHNRGIDLSYQFLILFFFLFPIFLVNSQESLYPLTHATFFHFHSPWGGSHHAFDKSKLSEEMLVSYTKLRNLQRVMMYSALAEKNQRLTCFCQTMSCSRH